MVKEEIFRRELQGIDFQDFDNTLVGFSNAHGHILPQWAPILLAVTFEKRKFGRLGLIQKKPYAINGFLIIWEWDTSPYHNARVSIKGCSELALSAQVYMAYARKLSQCAKVVSFGKSVLWCPFRKTYL